MSSDEITEHPPIYGRLVRERGDVLAEVGEVAEQMLAQARDALDWSAVRRDAQEREERAFSAFG
ncbi:hypothetical protein [Streptomyces sp. NPDC006552]|uniref:hypothetical protein n=1 Tax=Streptomyces sp. NPDC006552 TaxID=3157179 RepID=UPI0033AA10E9